MYDKRRRLPNGGRWTAPPHGDHLRRYHKQPNPCFQHQGEEEKPRPPTTTSSNIESSCEAVHRTTEGGRDRLHRDRVSSTGAEGWNTFIRYWYCGQHLTDASMPYPFAHVQPKTSKSIHQRGHDGKVVSPHPLHPKHRQLGDIGDGS